MINKKITTMNKIVKKKIKIININFKKRLTYIEPVNLYGCSFENDVFIGPFVEIQKNVKIGKNTRISSHSFICEKVSIGNNCFIGHGVMFTNDLFTGEKSKKKGGNWLPTMVGNNVKVGSGSTILPVKICDDVIIGAGSVITKDIKKPGIYIGNPAKFKRKIS